MFSDVDTRYIVGKRAQLLKENCAQGTYSVLVVRGLLDSVASTLKEPKFKIACINSPIESVTAGLKQDLSVFQSLLTAR